MTTTNPALRPSAPTPSPRPSAPMPPSPKPPANAPKTTTRCIASPPCSRIWPPSASTTSNPPTTCRHSSNSPPSPRCNGEPSNSSASLTASVTRRQYTHSNTTKPQVTPHTSPSQGELRTKAAEAKLLRTNRVRADTTVVPANVCYPTDSGLL